MGDKTKIQWTSATWNPVRGCSRVSEGCRNCYAETMAARFCGRGQPYEGLAERTPSGPRWTGEVRLVPEKLDQPLRWQKPRMVFVNSMSDLFHEKLSYEDIAVIFGVMAAATQHTFQILTKRPRRAREWFRWILDRARSRGFFNVAVCVQHDAAIAGVERVAPYRSRPWPLPNVWLGTSVEDKPTADDRIGAILETPAALRWVSYEPALGLIDFRRIAWDRAPYGYVDVLRGGAWTDTRFGFVGHSDMKTIDWIVVGGESGPGARPFDLAWARSTIAECREAGVPCFLKQLGSRVAGRDCEHGRAGEACRTRDPKGGDPEEWPEDLRVREFPQEAR